jgi:ubiquinone/menaquinone biosynthesis C-methylase UbiE
MEATGPVSHATESPKVKNPYRRLAGRYDRLFENMNQGLRVAGVRMFRPSKGMHILDVGCGTGAHLELYQRYGCHLYGMDLSPSMVSMIAERGRPKARAGTDAGANELKPQALRCSHSIGMVASASKRNRSVSAPTAVRADPKG